MTVFTSAEGRPIHYPADSTKFVFDGEVAEIFPDMARRSIPLFYETHDLHAGLAMPWRITEVPVRILDVGASRGAFLKALDARLPIAGEDAVAMDISKPMMDLLSKELPTVEVIVGDITLATEHDLIEPESVDILNCTYVLQFIPERMQVPVLKAMCSWLRPGGVMFLGQKFTVLGAVGHALHEQYIEFRLANGYTMEEIIAKTEALKNSMWPMPDGLLRHYVKSQGFEVTETSRWGVFNNYMCIKGM